MKVKDTHQGIFRAIHCGPLCWCNEGKCGLNGAPLYPERGSPFTGKWAISPLWRWIRQPRCIYSKHNVCVFKRLFCNHDLGHVWSNVTSCRHPSNAEEVRKCPSERERSALIDRQTDRWAALMWMHAGSFKYIVVIVLRCIHAALELVLVLFSHCKITNQYDLITTWATAE